MRMLIAARVGEQGFVQFLHRLHELGVLDRYEVLQWLALHGAVLRLDPPLDESELRVVAEELMLRPSGGEA